MKSLLLGKRGQWRGTEGNLSFGLITQRSKVQILPPQPVELFGLTSLSPTRNSATLLSSSLVTCSFSKAKLVTARWASCRTRPDADVPCYWSDSPGARPELVTKSVTTP